MTKRVRIENADTSNYKVVVQTWVKGQDGAPDRLIDERVLHYPIELVDFYISFDQYLVVKEG